MKQKRNDIHSAIAFIVFAIFLFAASWGIQPTTSDLLGSRFFPRLIAGLIVLLSLFQLSGALSRKTAEEDVKENKKPLSKELMMTIVALFAYYVLILQVGFTITSIIYLLFQSAVLMSKDDFQNKRRVVILVIASVLVPIFINTIFLKVFSIALPTGNLF